jgi:hypothetical protein
MRLLEHSYLHQLLYKYNPSEMMRREDNVHKKDRDASRKKAMVGGERRTNFFEPIEGLRYSLNSPNVRQSLKDIFSFCFHSSSRLTPDFATDKHDKIFSALDTWSDILVGDYSN